MKSHERTVSFDSPKSENGDVLKQSEMNDIKTIREKIQFFEQQLPVKESELPSQVEMIKQRLLRKTRGEEDECILSGDDCELSTSEEAQKVVFEDQRKKFDEEEIEIRDKEIQKETRNMEIQREIGDKETRNMEIQREIRDKEIQKETKDMEIQKETRNMEMNMNTNMNTNANMNTEQSFINKCIFNQPIQKKKTVLPTTSELLDDFTYFSSRPNFLNLQKTEEPSHSVNTLNLYSGRNLMFSSEDLARKEFVFRSPGVELRSRPNLTPLTSILTDSKTLHYIKVTVNDPKISWVILKELKVNGMVIPYNLMNDANLSQFILTDVVSEIFKRTNFLIYEFRVVEGRFLGTSLCLCLGDSCLKALPCERVEKTSRQGLLVDGVELGFSCEMERNEWINAIEKNKRMNV